MTTNHEVIVLTDLAADHSRLRSVLHDWGYSEKEIQRFFNEMSTPMLEEAISGDNTRVITS